MIWIGSVSISVNSYSPAVGAFSTITASIGSSNPSSFTYAWKYRTRANSGVSWGSWTSFASSANPVYSGTYTTSGTQWEYMCTVTNSAGSSTGYSVTVNVK